MPDPLEAARRRAARARVVLHLQPHVVTTLAQAVGSPPRGAVLDARAAKEGARAFGLQQFQRWKRAVRCARIARRGRPVRREHRAAHRSRMATERWSALTTETSITN